MFTIGCDRWQVKGATWIFFLYIDAIIFTHAFMPCEIQCPRYKDLFTCTNIEQETSFRYINHMCLLSLNEKKIKFLIYFFTTAEGFRMSKAFNSWCSWKSFFGWHANPRGFFNLIVSESKVNTSCLSGCHPRALSLTASFFQSRIYLLASMSS